MTVQKYETIAFISFESEFSPGGGLAAVMRFLPREMTNKRKTILITPFFSNIKKCSEAYRTQKIKFTGITTRVRYNYRNYQIRVLEYVENIDSQDYKIYFVNSPKFFLAPENPYINPDDEEKLFSDACFLCAAVPEVLKAIPEKSPFLLHLQDWETALISETMTEQVPHKCVLTLHNPYDHSLRQADLEKLCSSSKIKITGETVLSQTLPKMTGISTVSQNFAKELVNDLLHVKIYAPHLQEIFQQKQIIGIDNGIFVQAHFPVSSDPDTIYQMKNKYRKNLVQVMSTEIGQKMNSKAWGRCDFTDPSTPIILLFGRDDPRQKGYDVAVQAIRKMLQMQGDDYSRFVFTPMPGPSGLKSLFFLKELAEEFPRSVKVFPLRMSVGYMELQQAASYIAMCSLYEPFGGATEGYANGTPVIARATGGLVQQVDPYNYHDLSKDTQNLIKKFHGTERRPTGFLFKERITENVERDWAEIIRARYLDESPIGNPVTERAKLSLFNAMVDAATEAFKQAIELFRQDYAAYVELINNGFKLMGNFSWEKAVSRYIQELYA
ncbi:MAG: glycogen/starch synthase [Promethearchaeota archaeon]